jgi:hypothetical protein
MGKKESVTAKSPPSAEVQDDVTLPTGAGWASSAEAAGSEG